MSEKNVEKFLFFTLKINEERSRIRNRIRTKMSRIPNIGCKECFRSRAILSHGLKWGIVTVVRYRIQKTGYAKKDYKKEIWSIFHLWLPGWIIGNYGDCLVLVIPGIENHLQ